MAKITRPIFNRPVAKKLYRCLDGPFKGHRLALPSGAEAGPPGTLPFRWRDQAGSYHFVGNESLRWRALG